jgi:hypothetical protein
VKLTNYIMALGVGAASVLSVGRTAGGAETHDFARYQVIIDRSPFGAVQGAGAPAPTASYSAQFQLVGVVQSSNGVLQAVIFDKSDNHAYFRSVGETLNDVTVMTVEATPAKAVLKKGLESCTLIFEKQPVASKVPGMPGQPGGFTPGQSLIPGQPGGPSLPRRIPFRRETQ